jgi:nucleotide-binding universal stress UspA family protein
MPRFLVPVDFSAISVNAALYAVQMAESMPKKEVILYNVTEEVHAGADGTPLDFDDDAFLSQNLRSLESLQVNLFEMGLSPMDIVAEIGELPERIKPAIDKYGIDIVVMGISGNSAGIVGGNVLEISKESSCPVIIVPSEAMYKGAKKVALAVELKNIGDKTKARELIKKWLDVLNPELHFVYVGAATEDELTEEQKAEKADIMAAFSKYNTHFNLVPGKDFSQAINGFIEKNNIDQIVIFPKRHNMFASLFSGHHTEKLAYHSHIPVVTIPY